MQSRTAITYVLALALGTGIWAASTQMHASTTDQSPRPEPVNGIPLSWAPNWLVKPLSRAIADATDPRERDKETGAPLK